MGRVPHIPTVLPTSEAERTAATRYIHRHAQGDQDVEFLLAALGLTEPAEQPAPPRRRRKRTTVPTPTTTDAPITTRRTA